VHRSAAAAEPEDASRPGRSGWNLALKLYRQRFSEIGIFENGVYPEVLDLLAALHGSGRRLFVASSKPGVYVERIVDHFKLRPYFERVFGSELDGTRGDKTELLAYALGQTGDDPARTVNGRRPASRHDRGEKQPDDSDRRDLWVWQPGRTGRSRRDPCLRHAGSPAGIRLGHDPEKWKPVFRKDHAQKREEVMMRFCLLAS